jgi:hypothetical protein
MVRQTPRLSNRERVAHVRTAFQEIWNAAQLDLLLYNYDAANPLPAPRPWREFAWAFNGWTHGWV